MNWPTKRRRALAQLCINVYEENAHMELRGDERDIGGALVALMAQMPRVHRLFASAVAAAGPLTGRDEKPLEGKAIRLNLN